MRSMKKRIFTGIITAALAIAPFTGTGIDALDKNLTKSTAITADAWWWSKKKTYTSGVYIVHTNFTSSYQGNLVDYYDGDYILVDEDGYGRKVVNWQEYWADVSYMIDKGYVEFYRAADVTRNVP